MGNSKESQRDQILIFGLFAPNRYGIVDYEGYNIARLKDNYRSFIIMESNICEPNKEIPTYFNGAGSIYRELPKIQDMTEKIYKSIENKTLMLCKSALYSENADWLKKCDCFYKTNEIACVKP